MSQVRCLGLESRFPCPKPPRGRQAAVPLPYSHLQIHHCQSDCDRGLMVVSTTILDTGTMHAKGVDKYTCQECGSTELVSGHHRIPGDDSTIVTLCAEHHSRKHPDVPRALFFCVKVVQPYWPNMSAGSLAKRFGCHSRTIIRRSRDLAIPMGFDLSEEDQVRLGSKMVLRNERRIARLAKVKTVPVPRRCLRCGHHWKSVISHTPVQCPKCKSQYWNKPYSPRTLKMLERVRENHV